MTGFDFNDAGPQRDIDVIPASTIVTLQLNIRAGGAGDGGWLKNASDGAHGLGLRVHRGRARAVL